MPTTPIRASDALAIPVPAARIWPVLADVERYAEWWPPSVGARLLAPGDPLVGAELEIRPRAGRPFQCRVDAADPPLRMDLRYHGFVDGTGGWRLEPDGDGTVVTYALDVVAHGWLVAAIARVVPLAERHSGPMRDVLRALAARVTRPSTPAGAAAPPRS